MTEPNDEHDDDVAAEVHEGDLIEVQRFPVVDEDLDEADEDERGIFYQDDSSEDADKESPDAI